MPFCTLFVTARPLTLILFSVGFNPWYTLWNGARSAKPDKPPYITAAFQSVWTAHPHIRNKNLPHRNVNRSRPIRRFAAPYYKMSLN